MKLTDLGEFGLIELLNRELIANPEEVICGVGDDAAVIKLNESKWLLFTTDMLVEGVHFSLSYAAPYQVGIKAIAANVSDIAAMGGWPTHALVSLGVPLYISVQVLEGIYAGLRRASKEYGINIVGGDTVKSPERLIINVALLGKVEAGRAIYRCGARPKDLIFVTGTLGNSAAGLYLCQHPETNISPEASGFLLRAHLEPNSRTKAGRVLARTGRVSSMNDISDGLANELHEVCRASQVGCRIWAGAIPVDQRMKEAAKAAACDPLYWALYGGEDYELVFTVPPDSAPLIEKELKAVKEKCYLIGKIIPGESKVLINAGDGRVISLKPHGYDHFRKY